MKYYIILILIILNTSCKESEEVEVPIENFTGEDIELTPPPSDWDLRNVEIINDEVQISLYYKDKPVERDVKQFYAKFIIDNVEYTQEIIGNRLTGRAKDYYFNMNKNDTLILSYICWEDTLENKSTLWCDSIPGKITKKN